MILNLVSPDHGKVYFEGKETTNDNLLLLKNTGVLLEGSRNMFHYLHLRILFTGVDNVAYLKQKRSVVDFY